MKNRLSSNLLALKEVNQKFTEFLGDDPFPSTVEFQPIDKCNSKCSYCFNKKGALNPYKKRYKDKKLTTKDIKRLLQEISELGIETVSFSRGGEPLLFKGIVDVLETAVTYMQQTRLVTNGYLLNTLDDRLVGNISEIRISIDSFNPENYCTVRGVDKSFAERVFANLDYVCSRRNQSRNRIGISIMLLPEIIKDLEETIKQAKVYGIDFVEIKKDALSKHVHDVQLNQLLMQLVKSYQNNCFAINARFEEDFLPSPTQYGCYIAYRKTAIDMHGNLFPCCLQAQPRYPAKNFLCNILDYHSFEEAWAATKDVRDHFKKSVSCQYCNFADRLYNLLMAESSANTQAHFSG